MRVTRLRTADEEVGATSGGKWSTEEKHTSETTFRSKSSRNPSAEKLGSLITYPDYVRLRKNGSIKHDRDLNNSFYSNTSLNSRLEVHNSHHNDHSEGVTKKNGSPPGTVFNYYKQFNDYWNVFPKTDFTYSPTSMYYGKEIAPGIPIIPNLSRRALYKTSSNGDSYNYSFSVAPSQIRHLKNLRHVRQSTWEKVVTVITTVVTTTITIVTSIVSVASEPLVHPTRSPRRTFFFLLALLLLPLLYYLYFCDLEQNENESLVNRLNRLNFIDRSVFSQALEILKRPLLWLYWLFGELLSLIINTISMVPAFISQSYYATSAYFIAIFNNHSHTAPVTSQPVGKAPSGLTQSVKIDAQEIRKIVEEVLAEKQGSRVAEIGVNDMKAIVKEIVLEHEEKTKQENLDTVVAKAKQIITPLFSKQENSMETFMKGINEQVGNIEKSLEEQKEDINTFKPQIQDLEEKLTTQMQLSTQTSGLKSIDWTNGSTALSGAAVRQELVELVESALYKYHADRTGKTDYALMSNGGVIVSIRCTQTYRKTQGVMTLFGFSFWEVYNTPETIIKPGMMPGECWAFEGSAGYVVIKLAIPIYVTAVTIEHTPKELTHHGHIKSAPKQFSVWTLKDVTDENPEFIGRFKFLDTKGSLQTFDTKPTSVPSDLVELRIESNHGHLEYTCLYRFRVHGIPAS
ncbi:uncharacterized protein LOC106666141 isoform X1 [Cimex lectularius]|uniref:SUN domain-containing protein n=1 Tax=Cimex lectularius TaxID=79782 RepID=A0A8I6SQL9_CIMLE|nr:uncharacterized protein LOC106666141 isoform X1 [Cimex lectularius]